MDVLRQLQEANKKRCPLFGHKIEDWTPSEWGNAVAGETGEMCNLIKKLHRGDEIEVTDIAKEAADIVVYLDILCQRLGIDLQNAIVNKFNEVSARLKTDIKIYHTL